LVSAETEDSLSLIDFKMIKHFRSDTSWRVSP